MSTHDPKGLARIGFEPITKWRYHPRNPLFTVKLSQIPRAIL